MQKQTAKLKEVCKFLNGGTPSKDNSDYFNGDIPWITGADITSFLVTKVRSFITEKAIKESATNLVPAGTVLLVTRTSVGKVAVAGMPLCFSQDITAIRNDEKHLDKSFLIYFLKTKEPYFKQSARGATIGGITREVVSEIEIPLPSLPEQKRIAAILDKADRLRRQRRFAQTLSDSFLQSVFIKMFGNPLFNPKNFNVKKVGTQIKNIRYGTGSPPEYQDKGVPFVRATNVKGGTIQPKDMAFISESDAKAIPKCKVKEGDMIVVRSGVNTGDCALIPKRYDGAYAAYDLIVEMDYPMNHFYNSLINSNEGKAIILPLTRRAGQPHLNAEQVSDLEFPFPPLPLQEKFAEIVQKFERVRRQQREATRQAEHLFQTLLHRAFRGEL